MKEFTFENQGTHTYLVYTVGEGDIVDSMNLGMLTNNKIHGLAQTLFTQMDATKYIKYDISAHISVKQFFAGQVNKKRLLGVFHGIVDAMLSAEDYMIDVNSILLDLEYMFADVSTCETSLICLPIMTDDLSSPDLAAFFKNIMFTTQFDQTENCDHVAKIINYLNSSPVFSLEDFKKVLDGLEDNGTVSVQPPQPTVQKTVTSVQTPAPQPSAPQPVVQSVPAPVQKEVPQPVKQPPVPQTQVPQPPVVQEKVATPPQSGAPEKKMTMMNLLMHYNKENAELYKQQKAAKNAGKTAATPAPATRTAKATTTPGFAIPGQVAPAAQGFAIPGQQESIPAAPVQKPVQNNEKSAVPASSAPAPQQISQPTNVIPTYTPPQIPQGQAMNFGETTVLGGSKIGETSVLGAAPTAVEPKPYLIRVKNNEKINLDKPVFRIGKEKSYVDYFIADNTAISRSHANFITKDKAYFVVDTNSTNHTYVNGAMIQSNQEVSLAHGDKVRLANEDFEFKLY